MIRGYRKSIGIMISVLLPLLLSGCIPTVELRERGIIQAIGIDYDEGEYTLTFQVFKPESSGQQGLDVSKSNNKIIQSSGDSISDALYNATIEHGKQMFLGNNNLIVVGKETAKNGIFHIMNYFNANHDTNPKTIIVVSETLASDIVSTQTTQGIVPAQQIEMIINRAYQNGGSTSSQVLNLSKSASTYGDSGYISYVRKGVNFSGAEQIELVGTAIFMEDKMVGSLDLEETKGMLFGQGELKYTSMVVARRNDSQTSMEITSNKRKVKVKIEDGIPHFEINIKTVASIIEAITDNEGGVDVKEIENIKNQLEYTIESEVQNVIENTVRVHGADVFGLSLQLEKYEKDFFRANIDKLNEIYKKSEIDVNVEVTIDRMGSQMKHKTKK